MSKIFFFENQKCAIILEWNHLSLTTLLKVKTENLLFLFQKDMAIFFAILGHFIKHKRLISEECTSDGLGCTRKPGFLEGSTYVREMGLKQVKHEQDCFFANIFAIY